MTKQSSKAKSDQKVINQNYDETELKALPTKSAKIRYLTAKNIGRSEIVNILNSTFGYNIRYQHVRNVQVTLLKKDMN